MKYFICNTCGIGYYDAYPQDDICIYCRQGHIRITNMPERKAFDIIVRHQKISLSVISNGSVYYVGYKDDGTIIDRVSEYYKDKIMASLSLRVILCDSNITVLTGNGGAVYRR